MLPALREEQVILAAPHHVQRGALVHDQIAKRHGRPSWQVPRQTTPSYQIIGRGPAAPQRRSIDKLGYDTVDRMVMSLGLEHRAVDKRLGSTTNEVDDRF